MSKHFFSYLENTISRNWNAPALSDYDGHLNLSYGEMAGQIARLHILFKEMGLQKGDKIALCGRNSTHWAVSFLAITTYEAVGVSILPDFHPESIQTLVNHSDAKLLMIGHSIWNQLDAHAMPELRSVMTIDEFQLVYNRTEGFEKVYSQWNDLFTRAYPQGFHAGNAVYPKNNLDELALINYTSGTTSAPKGVMLTYRNLSSNIQFGQETIPNKTGWKMLSMLPLAHMFGLTFEFLYQLAGGCHVYFLSKTPSPQVLMKAFAEVKPYMILTVPLVIEKIFKKSVFPVIQKPLMQLLWYTPGIRLLLRKAVYNKLMKAFGGNLLYLIVGGAALNNKVENCLKAIKFPYTVGYGMTECAPIIGYNGWKKFKKESCGKIADRMEIKIDSSNPRREVGEILVRGENVMMGYYKNPEATSAVLAKDGWMHTGDLGLVDKQGHIFIKGRSKSMILGSSGQNIYPEEIEDKLNTLPLVVESVVLERDEHLVALVYPDYEEAKRSHRDEKSIKDLMEQNRLKLNRLLPNFCRVLKIELVKKEFEKTPKRSIKRFLYS